MKNVKIITLADPEIRDAIMKERTRYIIPISK